MALRALAAAGFRPSRPIPDWLSKGVQASVAARLHDALAGIEADIKIALLHYSPVEDTLRGVRLETYPFLGSYLLAEAIDRSGAHLALHGHAHGGTEKGMTPGGVHLRNVAQPVIKHAYHVYCLGGGDGPAHD